MNRIRRILSKPPRYIAARIVQELHAQLERYLAPRRARRLSAAKLARASGYSSVQDWWDSTASRSPIFRGPVDKAELQRICPGDCEMIFAAAERAMRHEVDLLGSGPVNLGNEIDWHQDFKTGFRWEPAYCRDISYNNLESPSDVKIPWELSRMQWVIPVAQAYSLSGDERYAIFIRDLISDWIEKNPYACSVNWACTMDVALRILSWTWFFQICHASAAWRDEGFQGRFLRSLYLHGDFTARHLEKSDVNGNHYTADAAGLVFAGLFFGGAGEPKRWLETGWSILVSEIQIQVHPDGVDFEASVPYHRLVQELFLLPAIYRIRCGMEVTEEYRERLLAMARFTEAYSRQDGSIPLWGDADDARALPFRLQPINDHRYLLALTGIEFADQGLLESFSGPVSEIAWLHGTDIAARRVHDPAVRACVSTAFPEGGFYVMRNSRDHIFVDCGPLGLSGRGGHGHNDLLSFEAVLDGVHLVTDCGAYLYTADYKERNRFRSTAYHNTPSVDGAEINRFIRPDYLWFLHDDAAFEVEERSFGEETDRLCVSHNGYARLPSPVIIRRTFALNHSTHRLHIEDAFVGEGPHLVEVPLHLAEGVSAAISEHGVELAAGNKGFALTWNHPREWQVRVEEARVSPTYGVVRPIQRISWTRRGELRPLQITLAPR